MAFGLILGVVPLAGGKTARAQARPPEEPPAAAQGAPRPENEAVAAELFRQGRTALEAGDYRAACPKLAESQRLSPRGGTLLNLALCHEREGKTASAWAEFGTALAQARREGRPDREAIAREHLGALEAKLSRLTVIVPPAAGDVAGLEVRCDGTEFKRAVWGEALPIDPGTHRIEASAPGRRPFRASVVVRPGGDRQSVRVPVLELAPAAAEEPARGGGAFRSLGWAALGVGAAGVGAAAVFGALAIREKGRADDRCASDGDAARCLDARGVDANERAKSFADVATVGAAAGLALAGAGVYLVLSHPRAAGEGAGSTALVAGPRGAAFVARF
ncbi:MAG TPA: hypothetical protein VFS00_14750 [Polyangiaceae bacterium]|nr:hypothetical protein [Polyangiaceae bacterium]